MQPDSRIFVAGHRGLAGSALVRRLEQEGFGNLILRTRDQLDLSDATAVMSFFDDARPEFVFLAAAKVGGIHANATFPADFIRDNLAIQLNVIEAAHRFEVTKLLFLGSSCVYPKLAEQPMREESLLTGPLEPTNEPYAIAKIAGLKMCEAYRRQYGSDFISVMPTNLYGPNDNFDLQEGHVLAALLRRFHEAKESGAAQVTVWGTGTPRREFLHADDFADASVFLMRTYSAAEPINAGWGRDSSIAELAEMIRDVVGFDGKLVFDTSKPDGTPRKLLDTSRLTSMGWTPRISLRDGIAQTYEWFLSNQHALRH